MSAFDPTTLLFNLDMAQASLFFVLALLLDVPRFTLAFCALAFVATLRRTPAPPAFRPAALTIVVVGHNEAQPIRRCILSLHEQTWRGFEIIAIDDGSTDGMRSALRRLREEGRIDAYLSLNRRGGKSAGSNLALARASGEVVVFIDADTTLDRDAIAHLVQPFADPLVGAVTGNIGVRNAGASVLTALQALEYMLSCSAGRQMLDQIGQLSSIAGAFCAFRRSAIAAVGGFDVGPGEDLDIALRLRIAGWRLRFATDAWSLTQVPQSVPALVRQRRRWERDNVRLRLRKHGYTLNPFDPRFRSRELPHQIEFLVADLLLSSLAPIYIGSLAATLGPADALTVCALIMLAMLSLNAIAALCALLVARRVATWKLLPYVFVFGLYQAGFLRAVRLFALVEEALFARSQRDVYVPAHVARKAAEY